MTSRRKQIKPSKAHSDPLLGHNGFASSKDVDIKPYVETHSGVNSITSKEDSTERSIPKIKKEQECILIKNEFSEVNVEEFHQSVTPLEEESEDITKKIHKDDAKILPFESNGGFDFFQCPLCSESSICGRENLTCHLQEHQNKTKRDDGKHLCCLCSKELSSNSSLERHLLTHSNHRPFSCVLCDKKFTTNGNLSRHIKTSHNNSGTIDSSIDEVLKKHQMETYTVTTSENSCTKHKKSNKALKKESVKMEVLGLKGYGMNMDFLSQSGSYMDSSKIDGTTYQSPLQGSSSSINVFSPFYSFNVNDFGYIQTNLSENLNLLNQSNLSIVTTNSNIDIKNISCEEKRLKRKQFDSLLPKRLLVSRRYRRRINLHLQNISRTKKFLCSANSIQCVKCHTRILVSTHVLSHIRQCYKFHKKNHLFCPFKLCSIKCFSMKSMLKHIRRNHLELYYDVIEPVSPPLEPLNLSIKKSSKYSPIVNYPSEYVSTSSSNFNFIESNKNQLHSSHPNSISMTPNSSDLSIHFPSFQTINQFISTPTIVTLSPFHFSTPLAFSTSSFLSKPTSVPVIVNNGSDNGNLNAIWHEKILLANSFDQYKKSSKDAELCVPSSLSPTLSSKYITGIKKKNSYKDAPKLITCPMDGCVQKFPWNSSLMRHILTHTAHKPFKCTRCVKSFSTKSNRERHMTRVHRVRINRSKFKSLQSSRALLEESGRPAEDGIDSENGADAASTQDADMRIIELSEEEWIIMDDNDRRAEDISSNLLKLAGQPIVEPNPVRLHNSEKKVDGTKYDSSVKKMSSHTNETFLFLDNCT